MVVIDKNATATTLDLAPFKEVPKKPGKKALDVLAAKAFQLGATMTLPARSVNVFEIG